MPRFSTRAVLGGKYPTGQKARHTHILDTRTNRVLCCRVKVESLADEDALPDDSVEATCPLCARRDPRNQRDANDGPRCLKHLFQF